MFTVFFHADGHQLDGAVAEGGFELGRLCWQVRPPIHLVTVGDPELHPDVFWPSRILPFSYKSVERTEATLAK
jgi:hypothetical protein